MTNPMESIKPHRRQFIVTTSENPERLSDLAGFQTQKLGEGLFLHHDQELLLHHDGSKLVLGRMIRPGDGRYVVIDNGKLSLDATGSLGVQYFSEGPVICSSSPTLLSLFSGRPVIRPAGTIKFSWQPAPLGSVPGSRRLMIDQVLDLNTRTATVERRTLSGPRTLESAAEQLAEEAVETAHALHALGCPLYVALTAGQDSRTIFSAFVAADIPFKAFTLLLSDGASHRDARIAARLCKVHNIEHLLIKGQRKGRSARRKLYFAHSSGVDGDRGHQYAEGNYYRFLPAGAIACHGGSLGLSKVHFDHDFENAPDLSKKTVLGILNENYGPLSDEYLSALGEWYDHRSDNPYSNIGDHFYLDQRRANWGADNRFAEDAFSFEWHIFANSWPLIDSFLSAPREARAGLEVQKRAIDMMTPNLNKLVPEVNSPMNLVDRWRGRLSRRGMQKLKRRLKGSA